MRKNKNPILMGCLLAGACLAPLAAQASPIVAMDFTSVAGPALGGVYTDPYYAKIGPAGLTQASQFTSSPIAIYCDDFYDDVSPGHIWQATVTNLGSLSSAALDTTLMFQNLTPAMQASDYMAAGWLAEQMAWAKLSTPQMQLDSYAMWYIFDPNALDGLSAGNQSGAKSAYDAAIAAVQNDTPSDFADVNIYTPIPSTPGHAGSQEYLAVDAPEPSTLPLALFGLGAVALAVRRRRRTAANRAG